MTIDGLTRRAFGVGLLALAPVLASLRPAAAQTASRTKIAVGVLPTSGSGPIFIARQKGYFAAENLDVEPRFFTAAHQAVLATMSGDVQFGAVGLSASFYNSAAGGVLKIVASQSRDEPGFPNIGLVASLPASGRGFASFKDIAGKRLGLSTVGSAFQYAIGRIAQKHGIPLNAYTLVPLQQTPTVLAALKGGQIDGALLTPNAALQAQQEGFGRLVGWTGDELSWQLGAVFATSAYVRSERSVIERFLRAYARGAAEYHAAFNTRGADGSIQRGPGYAELLALIAEAVGQAPDVAGVGMPFVDPEMRVDVEDIQRQIAFWQATGMLRQGVTSADVIDRSFVRDFTPSRT